MAFRSLLFRTHHLPTPTLRRLLPSSSLLLRPKPLSSDATSQDTPSPPPPRRDRPPRERFDSQNLNAEVLLPGCDFEHWLVFMDPPKEGATRDDIIDKYVKTLGEVVGSEEEAKMKIYSVSTRHYYAFGALISREVADKLKPIPEVHWVLPDSYLHPKTKDYGGEPFIDGKAVPYDPKYHAVWLQNNQRPPERGGRRQDRPRNYDRTRDNWQSKDFRGQTRPPVPNQKREDENHSGVSSSDQESPR